MHPNQWTRRDFLAASGALGLMSAPGLASDGAMLKRAIPASGEPLPVIGLGTYSVFDVDSTPDAIAERKAIVDLLISEGGSAIDTSPMYQRSEEVIGDVFAAGAPRNAVFLATKVWTDGREHGLQQMQRSARLMKSDVIDLMQVHNLRDTEVHLASIRERQEQGKIRYNGITHYTAGALGAVEAAMKKHKPQFLQINYSLAEREVEERILPLAQDSGVAVIINRPFQAGRLFRAVGERPLPEWATGFANSWGQFFLKFIVSHPAVTCVIPATSKRHHMADNLGAGFGTMPDPDTRLRMIQFIEKI